MAIEDPADTKITFENHQMTIAGSPQLYSTRFCCDADSDVAFGLGSRPRSVNGVRRSSGSRAVFWECHYRRMGERSI
jgi:hypothetical protein